MWALTLQQYYGRNDLETCRQYPYDIKWHHALDIVAESDVVKYICFKTFWSMRTFSADLDLAGEALVSVCYKLALLFKVDNQRLCIKSVYTRYNMARLGHIGIFVDLFL